MTKRGTLSETGALGRLLSLPRDERPVVFYAEDAFTYVQFEGYLNELLAVGGYPVIYITSDPADPLFGAGREGLHVEYLDKQLARFMKRVDGSLVVMTMPDLGRFHVPKPSSGAVLYFFHSLNSLHTSYGRGAFDHYDVFACTGPHHKKELQRIRNGRGLQPSELAEVGYYKLDRIARAHEAWTEKATDRPQILLAPSWGAGNILESCGAELIRALVSADLSVVVRPHPQFFHSLYPKGEEIVERLRTEFGDLSLVQFELTILTEDSFHSSDLMISDWSGAAYEYALGTQRPVLFIDTPQKLLNPEWADVGLPPFEDRMRREVGLVLGMSSTGSAGAVALEMIESRAEYRVSLRELLSTTIYNPGESAKVGAQLIMDIADRL